MTRLSSRFSRGHVPLALTVIGACCAAQSFAQSNSAGGDVVEEILVTGSYLRRTQEDMSSPVTQVSQDDIQVQGVATPADFVANLTFNSGSEGNLDQSDQERNIGTSQVNLRGLGLSSTLVLIDGRRQTLSASASNSGQTFVDVNSLMPMIMIDEVEILKDGASALYGTDAVAGVVNYKTRRDFDGFELQLDYRRTTDEEQEDLILQAIGGASNGTTHVVAAASYLDRAPLWTCDRDFSCTPARTLSSFGNPGTFLPLAPVTSGPFTGTAPLTRVVDPDCPPERNTGSACVYNFGPNNALVPDTNRLSFFTTLEHEANAWFSVYGEAGFTRTITDAPNSPSLPLLGFGSIVVPADHPNNVFDVPAVWLGRPFADAGKPPGENRNINEFDDTTYRIVTGVKGDFPSTDSWRWDAAFDFSANQRQYTLRGTLASEFLAALEGLGGADCQGTTPGANGCLYFNPFGTALTTAPNDPELIDFVTTDNFTEEETDLWTVDAIVAGDVLDLPAGPLGLAVGAQFRQETRSIDSSGDAEREDIFFFFGGVDADVKRDVWAVFSELLLPVFDNGAGRLEAQLALRHEDYGSGIKSSDPKIGILYQPTDGLSLRGSWGTSFRTASLLEIGQEQVAFDAFLDPISGVFSFVPSVARPNPDLEPQEATYLNFGATWQVTDRFRASVDYYSIELEDLLTSDNTAQLLAEEFAAYQPTCTDPVNLVGCDQNALNAEQILRDPVTLAPQRVFRNRFNAASADTSGFDLSLGYDVDGRRLGFLSFDLIATHVLEYKVRRFAGAPEIEAAGSRNKLLQPLARSMPEWKINFGTAWARDAHRAQLFVRYIDSYFDDQNDTGIDDFVSVDAQYVFAPSELLGVDGGSITVGVNNLFDEDPPFVNSETGYDPKVHSPAGRVVYLRLGKEF